MSSTPVCILLVDDKPENLLALEELLKQPDRQLFRAGSGNEALRLLLKHEFALVLLDVQMPEMDGYETAQLMRGAEPTRSVPIIFVTAGDRSEERAFRGYEVGAVDFLYKPVNPQVLQSKVDVFVELHRRNQDLRVVNAGARADQRRPQREGRRPREREPDPVARPARAAALDARLHPAPGGVAGGQARGRGPALHEPHHPGGRPDGADARRPVRAPAHERVGRDVPAHRLQRGPARRAGRCAAATSRRPGRWSRATRCR